MANVLTSPAPTLTPREAEAIVMLHFGLETKASLLPGERDRNFRIIANTGSEYLLKLINPAEDPEVTRFQNGAIRHIAASDPGLAVPRLVETADAGDIAITASGLRARLTTYVAGNPLAARTPSASLRVQLGGLLARVDQALGGYGQNGKSGALLWDLANAGKLRALVAHVEEETRRTLVERVLDRFDARVGPTLAALPRQAIHNDFNPSNVLVDNCGVLCGVIDFGDVVMAPRIQDLAVAAAYHVPEEGDPLTPILEVVEGYHAVTPLASSEAEILLNLIELRMVMTAIISSWRASLDPGNRDYIMRHAARAWNGLARFRELDPRSADDMIRRRVAAPP